MVGISSSINKKHIDSKPINSFFDNRVNASKEKKYSKINLSTNEISFRRFVIVITLGIARAILNIQFENALQRGDIKAAEKAYRRGACNYLDSKSLIKLNNSNQTESLRFLRAQIDFPEGKPFTNRPVIKSFSRAAKEFIYARDGTPENAPKNRLQRSNLLKALPNEEIDRVFIYDGKSIGADGTTYERVETFNSPTNQKLRDTFGLL